MLLFCPFKICRNMAVVRIALFTSCLVFMFGKSQAFCGGNDGCTGTKVCCNYDKCRHSCVGYDCVYHHSNCGGDDEYCCNYTCQKGECEFAAWVIVIIVLSVLGLVCAVVAVVLFYYCSRRRRAHGLVVSGTLPVATTTFVAGSNNVNYGAVCSVVQTQEPKTMY